MLLSTSGTNSKCSTRSIIIYIIYIYIYLYSNSGYINLDNFFELIKENESSIVAPFLERLYKIIERTGENIENRERNNLRDDSLICFEEFLSALSTFCLFSKDQLITCIFYLSNHYLIYLISPFSCL